MIGGSPIASWPIFVQGAAGLVIGGDETRFVATGGSHGGAPTGMVVGRARGTGRVAGGDTAAGQGIVEGGTSATGFVIGGDGRAG